MTGQQPLFSDRHESVSRAGGDEPAPVWLQRMSLIVLVMFCLYIGVLLTILPWSSRYWDHNAWLVAHPAAHALLTSGWARGILSGFGLLDIWIGVSEAMHYRDFRSSPKGQT